jgi:hypothetical protein
MRLYGVLPSWNWEQLSVWLASLVVMSVQLLHIVCGSLLASHSSPVRIALKPGMAPIDNVVERFWQFSEKTILSWIQI